MLLVQKIFYFFIYLNSLSPKLNQMETCLQRVGSNSEETDSQQMSQFRPSYAKNGQSCYLMCDSTLADANSIQTTSSLFLEDRIILHTL